jgi:4-hydroxy-tetrahydrodipicolinate reductase
MPPMAEKKKVVVWGTGFVGKMVIPEVLRHPNFELVGVGVSDKDKVGRDVGNICGLAPTGLTATDDLSALVALRPDALVHYGPTAGQADANIRDMGAFLRAGIDVCSTAMTPWVWPHMKQNPPSWIDPITEACAEGGATCFTTGIDPGFANDLFPMTLMGLCAEVKKVKALEILDYLNYTGDYEDEMGIGRSPEFTPLLQHTDILVMSWGGTVPMMAHAVGIELDEVTSTWDKWVTDVPITTAKGVINPGEVAAIHFTINGMYKGEPRICLEHINRVGTDAAPDWPRGTQDDVYRVEIEGTPSITQETAFRFTDGSGRDAAAAGCLATGLRALNAVPAVNDLAPGWATALDLPLIPGAGTVR